jgi:hypothetical protein
MPVISNVHNVRPQQAYGLTNSIYAAAQNPMVIPRHPQVTDFAFLGTLWIDPTDQSAWVLVAILANQAQWTEINASVAAATTYETDTGDAIPALGVLQVVGTPNEIETSGAGNTVTVGLPDTVEVIDDIVSINGNITTTVGNISSAGGLTAATNLIVGGNASIGGLANNGIVQTNNTHGLIASNGANGQLLIGGGAAPSWNSLTSTGNTIAITQTANNINLETTDNPALASFSGLYTAAVNNVTGDNTVYQLKPDTITLNDNGCYNATSGAYTAPATGNYFISTCMAITGMTSAHTGVSVDIYINVPVPSASSAIQTINCNPWDCSNSIPDVLKFGGNMVLYLTAGQKLTFSLIGNAGTKVINIDPYFVLSVWPIY